MLLIMVIYKFYRHMIKILVIDFYVIIDGTFSLTVKPQENSVVKFKLIDGF